MSLRIHSVLVLTVLSVSACGSSGGDGQNGSLFQGSHSGTSTSGTSSGSGNSSGDNTSTSSGDSTSSGSDTSPAPKGDGGKSTAGDDGGTGDDSGSAGDEGGTTNPSGCFPSVTDYTAMGPFTAMTTDVTSVQCTIIRPTTLGMNGCKNPVIVWGNGTTNSPSTYAALFNHFASQGFIVAAADTSNAGSGKEMLACLQYVLDQAGMSGSPFEGKVDTKNIASSGYSQGGAGCLAAGEDPRFNTVLAVSPYVVISLGSYDPSTYAMAQIHPLFMISGDADVVAPINNNQQPIFQQAPVPIFWGTHAGSTHFEVLGSGGAYAGPMTAWFRWKLMGDPQARKVFEKPDCTLCSTSGWTVQTNSKWM